MGSCTGRHENAIKAVSIAGKYLFCITYDRIGGMCLDVLLTVLDTILVGGQDLLDVVCFCRFNVYILCERCWNYDRLW